MKEKIKLNHGLNILLFSAGLLSIFLIFRNLGLYPTVLADEYTYSKLSRLLPMKESTIPSYLYLKLYSITNYCGDNFFECAKLINVILFVSAIPFIYSTSRNVANNSTSIIVTLLTVIGPINTYTAYFMPESFYFLSFWIFSLFLIKLDSGSEKYRWIVAGAIYGISALIKPHSIFFLPAIIAYIIFIFFRDNLLFTKQSIIAAILFAISALVVKLLIGYLLAGPAGVTFFGPLYDSIAISNSSDASRYAKILALALENIKGHLLVIALIYGLPAAIAISLVINFLFNKSTSSQSKDLRNVKFENMAFFTLAVILNLILVVGLFTASVASSGPYETPYRLHMRYYNFALPLFYIVAAGAISIEGSAPNKYLRYIFGGIAIVSSIYAIYINLAPYTPSLIDSPEIRGFHTNLLPFQILGGLLIMVLTAWIAFDRLGIKIYLYLALPLIVLTSSYYATSEQRGRMAQDIYDKAGIFAKQYLSDDSISKTLIIGSEPAGLFRSLFYLDNSNASLEVIAKGVTFDLSKLPSNKEWILNVGNQSLSDNTYFQLPMNGFALIRASESNTIDFKKSVWPGVIAKALGLSSPEAWGTWSDSDIVTFEFSTPLPEKFELHLVAHAFGPNIEEEFEVHVGTSIAKFNLLTSDEQKILELDNPSRSRIIRFSIPKPISPRTLGISSDERNLGIGFVKMKIVPF